MDPLSIAASSIAVVTICSQVASLITKWTTGTRQTDSSLKNLEVEVFVLSTVVTSVQETFQRPELSVIVANSSEARLWQTLADNLRNCRKTIRRLKRILKELDTGGDDDSFWRRGARNVKFKSKKDEIAEILRSIQSQKTMIQVVLQCASVCVNLHVASQSEQKDQQILAGLQTIKGDIRELRDSRSSKDTNLRSSSRLSTHERIREHETEVHNPLNECIEAAEEFVDESSSTIYSRSTTCSESSRISQTSFQMYDSMPTDLRSAFIELKEALTTRFPGSGYWGDLDESTKKKNGVSFLESMDSLISYWPMDQDAFQLAGLLAVIWAKDQVLQTFIRHGLEINRSLTSGRTKLIHVAIFQRIPAIVELLIRGDADVNAVDYSQGEPSTPLEIALRLGYDEIALILIRNSARTRKCIRMRHAVTKAAHKGDKKRLEELLEEDPVVKFAFKQLLSMYYFKATAMEEPFLSLDMTSSQKVELASLANAVGDLYSKIDAMSFNLGMLWFGMIIACILGDDILLRIFLDHGADPNGGVTHPGAIPPLIIATGTQRNVAIAKILIDYGADPNIVYLDTGTPLITAMINKRDGMEQLFIFKPIWILLPKTFCWHYFLTEVASFIN